MAHYDWIYNQVSGRVEGSLESLKTPGSWQTGADYVTMTRRGKGDEWGDGLDWESWHRLQSATEQDGAIEIRASDSLGYRGYQFPGCFWGVHLTQGEMMRASGASAKAAVAAPLRPDHVSRLDVQLTLWGVGTAPELIKACADQAAGPVKGRKGPVPIVRLIKGYGRGDTCYIGSRRSKTFLRVYDKALESGELGYRDSVRFECELKDEKAVIAYNAIHSQSPPESACIAIVRDAFAKHGIFLPENIGLTTAYNSYVPAKVFSADRTLEWLHTQVGPSIIRLLDEGVSLETINDKLGLVKGAIKDVYIAEARRVKALEQELFDAWNDSAREEYEAERDQWYNDCRNDIEF